MDDYLSDKEQVDACALVARERLVLDRRRGDRPARPPTATTIFRVPGPPIRERAPRVRAGQVGNRGQRHGRRGDGFCGLRSEFPTTPTRTRPALLVGERRGRRGARRRGRKAALHDGGEQDPELAMVARLRLARVLAYREQHQEALALAERAEPGQFAGRIAEIRGDIHAALGETDAARTAYLEAMVPPGAELLDRGFLQMKLADLPAVPLPPPAAAVASPDAAARSGRGPAEPRRRRLRNRLGRRMRRRLRAALAALATLAVVLAGCAGSKDTTEPPGRAHRFQPTIRDHKVWSSKVGGKSERLRLGLRPATDGARIFAGAYDGQVAAFDAVPATNLVDQDRVSV